MKDISTAFKLLAPWAGFAAIVLGGIWAVFKYLITDFFNSQKRIKEMEAKEVLSAVQALESAMTAHRIDLRENRTELRETTKVVAEAREQLLKFQFRIDQLIRLTSSLTGVVIEKDKQGSERIQKIERTLEEAELVKIGPNSFMIRSKRPPSKS